MNDEKKEKRPHKRWKRILKWTVGVILVVLLVWFALPPLMRALLFFFVIHNFSFIFLSAACFVSQEPSFIRREQSELLHH